MFECTTEHAGAVPSGTAGGGGSCPPVILGKSALFASRCPFSYAKSAEAAAAAAAAAGCPSEPRTAPPPQQF